MFTYAVVGFGARGRKYSALLKERGAKLVAVCDCDPAVFAVARKDYGLSEDALFTDYESFFSKGKLADLLIVATTDREHTGPAVRGMRLGYDILLEKPIATSWEECDLIERTAEECRRRVIVCHVLRYSPFFRKIKQLIDSGKYGKVVTINHTENVAYWHFAHSFVRGNWRNEAESTFMLLAKCCHDLDILVYLIGSNCRAVSSMGALSWFTHDNPEKGADFCFECNKTDCAYNAQKFYLANPLWVKLPCLPEENRDQFILDWLKDRDNPYARCVYACDNDVVDHQIVNMQFAGGVTAHLTLTAFTNEFYRNIKVCLEKGVIEGDMREKTLHVRAFGEEEEVVELGKEFSGSHGGGDEGLIHDVCEIMEGRKQFSDTSIGASMQSHKIAFAAERSRRENGVLHEIR